MHGSIDVQKRAIAAGLLPELAAATVSLGMALELRSDILGILLERREVLFSGFDERERSQFLNMLDRMINNMLSATDS